MGLIKVNSRYSVRIVPKKSITVITNETGKETSFNIGDRAEYDSYNYSYCGHIVSITEKSVTIKEQHKDRKHRLKLDTFCWRNYNFDLESTQEKNIEASYNI